MPGHIANPDDPVAIASEQSFPASDPPSWIPVRVGGPELNRMPKVTKGLYMRLEAKPGREREVAAFLDAALILVEAEATTTACFALRMSATTFGIFGAFADDAGRDLHLVGPVARTLMERASGMLALAPTIDKIDIIGRKLP